MPSIAAHMAVSKLVGDALNIYTPDFIRGNLLPDVTIDRNSHHKIQGTYFMVPDLDYFRKTLDFHYTLNLGYYVHILLDYYFLEEFVLQNVLNLDVFIQKIMYNDYSLVSFSILNFFGLNQDELYSILQDYPIPIDLDKLNYNLNCLKETIIGKPKSFELEKFLLFLQNISVRITEEVREYASKSRQLSICPRK